MTRLTVALGLLGTLASFGEAQTRFLSMDPARDSAWVDRAVHVRTQWAPTMELHWELVVPAPIESVWAAWTEPHELIKWAAPGAAVDLRVGGVWEAHFNPDRPPGQRGSDANEILGVEPGRRLLLAAGAPEQYPTVRAEKTLFEVRLEQVGTHHTRIFVSQAGWRDGSEWEAAFRYLARANAEWLNWLHRRFVQGALDWAQMGFSPNTAVGRSTPMTRPKNARH